MITVGIPIHKNDKATLDSAVSYTACFAQIFDTPNFDSYDRAGDL